MPVGATTNTSTPTRRVSKSGNEVGNVRRAQDSSFNDLLLLPSVVLMSENCIALTDVVLCKSAHDEPFVSVLQTNELIFSRSCINTHFMQSLGVSRAYFLFLISNLFPSVGPKYVPSFDCCFDDDATGVGEGSFS